MATVEIAHNEQFLLLPQCFQSFSAADVCAKGKVLMTPSQEHMNIQWGRNSDATLLVYCQMIHVNIQ